MSTKQHVEMLPQCWQRHGRDGTMVHNTSHVQLVLVPGTQKEAHTALLSMTA